jgi:hypothetical protein
LGSFIRQQDCSVYVQSDDCRRATLDQYLQLLFGFPASLYLCLYFAQVFEDDPAIA